MAIISKHKIRLVKLFLVNPTLEKIFLFIYVLVVPFLALSNRIGNHFSGYSLGLNLMNIISQTEINTIQTTDNLADWITNTLAPSYFTTKTTVNKPLFPIFLFKSKVSTDDCGSLTAADIDPSCSFANDNDDSGVYDIVHDKGFYGSYQISDRIQISRTNTTSDLTTLNTYLKTTWLNQTTTFLSVQSIYYNAWSQVDIQFVVDFEFNYAGYVSSKRVGYNVSYPTFMKGAFFLLLYTLFVIQVVVFTLKILFEFSIAPNKYTFMGHTLHFALQYAYIFTCAIAFQHNKAGVAEYNDTTSGYNDADSAISSIMLANTFMGMILIFYPLRFFTLVAVPRYLATPIKMVVVLYRTIPGVMLAAFSFIIVWACYALALFMGLRRNIFQLRSYGSAFLNYFNVDLGNLSEDDIALNKSGKALLNLTWAFESIAMGIFIIYTIVIIMNLVKRSFAFELPSGLPHQQEFLNRQTELHIKFEKLLKELNAIVGKNKDSNNPNSSSSQDKMVIWLEHNMGADSEVDDIIEQLNGEQIKIIVFYKPEEVEEFLKYLFKLKPKLLTSQSGARFRLVFETKFEKGYPEKRNIEVLLDWLKGVGCRVPFLLFTKAELERDTYIPLKKKYPSLFASEDKSGALTFCRMEGKLENLNFKMESNENKYVVLENDASDISMDLTQILD